MWSSSSTDDGGKMASILKVVASTLGVDEDDGREMPKDHGSSLVEEDDQGGNCKMPKDCGSFSVEEADKGGNRKMHEGRGSSSVEEADKGGEISLKKGQWTQAEDAILKEYVEKHGEGNWKAVQKNSGLARCGKSCRLRWANHLRPDLKKGAFTKEEEQRIFELHASMGNKWSKMAAELPGRTDNEIKNFWNTRMKRRQRAGLTTYAKEVEIYRQVPNGNQENLNPNTALTNEVGQLDNVSQRMLSHLEQSTYSSQYNMSPMLHPSKRFRGSDMICNSLDPSVFPVFDQYGNNRSDNITEHPSSLSPYDLIGCDQFGNDLTGSHADVNDNISTSSDPINGAFKVELPSVRYFEARKRIWHTQESSLPPLAESVETPESSTQFQPTQSVPVSPQNNDGLLESVLYGSKNLNGSNNVNSFQENNVDSIGNGLTGSHADSNVSASFDPIYGAFKVELPSIQYFEPPKHIWHTHESLLPPLVVSVDTPESSTQFQPNQSLPVSPQNNDGLLESVIYGSNNLNHLNNVDSFQENNDGCVLHEEVQNSTLNPCETQWDEQETVRSSLGPFDCSVETTEDHGTLTEFQADSPSQDNLNLIELLLDPDPAPDLSFIGKNDA